MEVNIKECYKRNIKKKKEKKRKKRNVIIYRHNLIKGKKFNYKVYSN
jgi:hypothetical protein